MKTVKKLTLLLFVSFTCISYGQNILKKINGNGNIVTETRKIDNNFTKIVASRGINLYITQGNEVNLTVKADENLHDYIVTKVKNGKLKVYFSKGNIGRAKSKKVYLTVPNIDEIKSHSGSLVKTKNTINAKSFKAIATSGGNLKLTIKADDIISKSNTGGNITISGKTNTHRCKASTGGNISAYTLKSKSVISKARFGGNIYIFASESIIAGATFGGDIRFKGNPKTVKRNRFLGGNIKSK